MSPHTTTMTLDPDQYPPEVQQSLNAYGTLTQGVRRAHTDSHDVVAPPHAPSVGLSRENREEAMEAILSPGATRARGAGSRKVEEEPDPHRLCFERDRDRIVRSTAFRRLAGKTQVVIAPVDDHLRNRLTHAVEVTQVATSLAAVLGLNVPLAEAIALGHDCGHGPAGHASEEAFTPFLPDGYDHAPYGAHVVLAKYNLTQEVIDGIANHSWKRPAPATPEGEVVSWADRIAYLVHDHQDALRAGIVSEEQLPSDVRDLAGTSQGSQINFFIQAMRDATVLSGHVGMTEEAASVLDSFRRHNFEKIYLRSASRTQGEKAISMLRDLVDYFIDAPGRIPDVANKTVPFPSTPEEAAALAVHYVSGMTDRYAITLAVKLLGWAPTQLPRNA